MAGRRHRGHARRSRRVVQGQRRERAHDQPARLSARIGRCPQQDSSTAASLVGSPTIRLRARRCPVTATPTCASSGPAIPGCGPPTTSSGPTRRCASSCWRRDSPGSARRAVTVAGCRGWCRGTATGWRNCTAATACWPGSVPSTTPSTRSSTSPSVRTSTRASSRAGRWRSPATRRRPRGWPPRSTRRSVGRSTASPR